MIFNQQDKSFFTAYVKQRKWFNLIRFILGENKFKFFEQGKQPKGYKSMEDLLAELIDLDVKDVELYK